MNTSMNSTFLLYITRNDIDYETIGELSKSHHSSYIFPDLVSAAESDASNVVSLLTSTLPSHHQIWSFKSELGIHVDSILSLFNKNRISTIFCGAIEWEKLAGNLGYTKFENIAESNLKSNPNLNQATFLTHISPNTTNIETDKVWLSDYLSQDWSVMMIVSGQNSFYFLDNSDHSDNKYYTNIISIVDIAPTLASLMNLTIPYTWIGHSFHKIVTNYKKNHTDLIRDSALYEYDDGSKILITKKYRMKAFLSNDDCEVYDRIEDPQEKRNLWNDPIFKDQKQKLLLKFLSAQLQKEISPMPRIAGA